ncbi:EAL domain-containing protein [Sulfurovum sp.]|uniref:sensor domain-containing protein n=1 Tax=Sulfurovum sp. TaxID=1969726 RepID=UPI0035626033
MNYLNILLKISNLKLIDKVMVSNLYSLSQRSIIATIFLSTLLTYYLYPMLSYSIVLWNIIVVSILVIRLYLAYDFQKNEQKYTIKKWYKVFLFFTFLTAFLFSLLGSVSLFYVDTVHQVFIIAVMIGFTSGAMSSLFPDIRILVGYLSIILLPVIAVLLVLPTTMHTVLAVLVILYLIIQSIVILNSYEQSVDLERQKETVSQEQFKLHKKEEELEYLYKQAPIGIFSYDTQLNVKDCNQAFLELFGLKKEEIIGRNLADLPDKRSLDTIQNALVKGVQIYIGPYVSIKGFEYWVESKCFPIFDNDQNTVGGIGLIENKTKEHQALKDLEHFALHDSLTALLNRRGLKEYMNKIMRSKKHKDFYSLFVYLDLNKFKHVNDSLGHKVGDRLLIAIADRLNVFVSENCMVSRFGGDEFIVVSPFIAQNVVDAEIQSKVCIDKIQKAFLDPFIIDEMSLSMSTSLGVVIIEPRSSNIDEIIRYADIAMYQAKKSFSDHPSFYDTELDKERKRLFLLQHDLVDASKKNELKIYLQPLVTMEKDTLFAAECLLRWEHPELGLLSPIEFIPMAIETGLISDVTWWVIDEMCQYIASLKKENLWNLNYISINVNAKQLLLNHFDKEFLGTLAKYELDTTDIMIEITERSIIDNFEDTKDVINVLREEGVKCAIDDFGIGYSSLSYLKKLSFDTLKIDMEFIKDIKHRPDDIRLVKTILDIGKQFNYHIVVEGIEEEAQKELLLAIDKDLVYQGYIFSKPVPSEMFAEKFLK